MSEYDQVLQEDETTVSSVIIFIIIIIFLKPTSTKPQAGKLS